MLSSHFPLNIKENLGHSAHWSVGSLNPGVGWKPESSNTPSTPQNHKAKRVRHVMIMAKKRYSQASNQATFMELTNHQCNWDEAGLVALIPSSTQMLLIRMGRLLLRNLGSHLGRVMGNIDSYWIFVTHPVATFSLLQVLSNELLQCAQLLIMKRAFMISFIALLNQWLCLIMRTFYPEIPYNLMFEKCEFCGIWDFENVNFVKNEISEVWIL